MSIIIASLIIDINLRRIISKNTISFISGTIGVKIQILKKIEFHKYSIFNIQSSIFYG